MLTTRQYRAGVSAGTVEKLSDTLDQILQGGYAPVPGCPGYIINGAQYGHDLIVTIWHGTGDEDRSPIMSCAVNLKSRSAPALWQEMINTATLPLACTIDDRPQARWVADRIENGAALHPDALVWTGDFSRCLAWTWHNYRRPG